MSRIAIDIRPLLDRHMTGVGFALLEALSLLLPHASPTREYLLFASGTEEALERIPHFPAHPHVRIIKKYVPNKIVTLLSLFSPHALDSFIDEPFDAWWFPNWTVISTKKPFALTVHDLSFHHTPHYYSFVDRLLVALARPHLSAQRARMCIAVSSQTATDLSETWNVPRARIHTVPLGVHHAFFSVREQPSDRSYRASYDLNRPYLFSLATHEPRKNILGLLEGYQCARAQSSQPLPPLVLAGKSRVSFPHHLLSDVHFLGYIPHKHRAALYRGASAVLFPSFNEGFGLPVLEALACGTPVVTSAATPPSTLGSLGIFPADPYNAIDIGNAILDCLAEPRTPEYRQALHDQTRAYSWEAHATALERLFQRLC